MDNKCSFLIHLAHIIICCVYVLRSSMLAMVPFAAYFSWMMYCVIEDIDMEKRYALSLIFSVFFLFFHTLQIILIQIKLGKDFVYPSGIIPAGDFFFCAIASAGAFLNTYTVQYSSERLRMMMRRRLND